jgi:hypothetical protein
MDLVVRLFVVGVRVALGTDVSYNLCVAIAAVYVSTKHCSCNQFCRTISKF